MTQLLGPELGREKVGFIVPSWTGPTAETNGVPFRCMATVGSLLNAGHPVVWFDQFVDGQDPDLVVEAMRAASVLFIWWADLYPTSQVQNTIGLAWRLKTAFPDKPIVCGGAFFRTCPAEALFVDGPIDFFVRSPGEQAAPALVAALRGEESLDGVSGLVWKDGTWRSNPIDGKERMSADQNVAYRALDLKPYIQNGGMFANGQPTLIVATARGCAKGCSFCYWREHEPGLLKADAIIDLLEFLRDRYSVRQFHLAELDFFASKGRVLAIASLFKARLPDCTWFSLGSPSDAIKLSDAEWDLLAESGCRKIELGAESGSARMLAALGKQHEADAPYVIARRMLARGIVPRVNFIFGLPDEAEEDVAASLDLIGRLHALDPGRVVMTYRLFVPTWETPLGEKALARFPDVPRNLEEMVAWRERTGQEAFLDLAWLPENHRRLVRGLVRYFLPMVTNRPHIPAGLETLAYRSLRLLARARFRFRLFGGAFEPPVFRKLFGTALEQTCFP